MKICNKCGEEKEFTEFYKRSDSKDGYRNDCKSCFNEKNVNKNKYNKVYQQNYRKLNKGILNKKSKEFYLKKKEIIKERNNIYYHNNKDIIKEKLKKYRVKNKDKHLQYLIKNKYKIKKQTKDYYINNKERISEKRINNHKYKWENDIFYKMSITMRNIVYKSLKRKGYSKTSKTHNIIGCDYEYLCSYLQEEFEPWMNWDNYGKYNGEYEYGWDIDHIIPLSSAKSLDEIIKLNHFSNLQPLCSKINRDIKRNLIHK